MSVDEHGSPWPPVLDSCMNKKDVRLTLLELAVVAGVLSILLFVLLDRVRYYQEAMEKVVMETTASNIRSGLRMQLADMMIHNRQSEFSRLAGETPINWLAAKPGNYLGEYDGPKPEEMQISGWYFDLKDKTLVYLPYMTKYFQPDPAGRKRARYRVVLVYGPDQENRVVADNKVVEDVVVELREPYRWF